MWKTTKTWDEEVSDEFKGKWSEFYNKIHLIVNVKVPRWTGLESNVNISLHGFSDASAKGLGAVIYVRIEKPNGQITVTQLTAKSRVAPLNVVLIPSSIIVSKTDVSCEKNMEWETIPYTLLTDSMVNGYITVVEKGTN